MYCPFACPRCDLFAYPAQLAQLVVAAVQNWLYMEVSAEIRLKQYTKVFYHVICSNVTVSNMNGVCLWMFIGTISEDDEFCVRIIDFKTPSEHPASDLSKTAF